MRAAAVVLAVLFLAHARVPVTSGCTIPAVLVIFALALVALAALVWLAVLTIAPPGRGRHRLEAS